jgi:hypothetical protein
MHNGGMSWEPEASYIVQQVINRAAIVGEFHTALMNVGRAQNGQYGQPREVWGDGSKGWKGR